MLKRVLRSVVAGALVGMAAAVSSAAPQGHEVVFGDVRFHQNADGSVTVIHASDGSIIEYASFDIFAGELVKFVQPGADARVLNRVFGDATHIQGTLEANGIVYILNPAGIFLDGDPVIEVGGLVAAAGDMTNQDFLAGVDRFELSGPVVNEGAVKGDLVALLGTRVENHGSIRAPEGVIALVAGEKVVLARLGGRVLVEVDGPALPESGVGVAQHGEVDAGGGQAVLAVGDHYSLAINHTGVTTAQDVTLHGGDGVVSVRGTLDASDVEGAGGSIRVTGDRIALVGATLDASGATGGGDIRVGGDRRGEGDLPTALRTFVDGDSVLRADATGAGDGGSVVVWGDEAAVMAGQVSARGGAAGGDGGFAEVSSLGMLEVPGDVDLRADAGRAGTFLIDPQDIVILGGTADGSDDPNASDSELESDGGVLGTVLFGDVGDGTDPFEIYESEIEGTNANLVLEARNSVTVSGTFDNDAGGEGTGVVVVMDDNDLTIRTRNDTDDELGSAMAPGIDLGGVEWRTGGSGSIEIATGDDGVGGGGSGLAADVAVGDLATEGGSITITTTAGAITTGDLRTDGLDGATGGDAGAVTVVSGGGDVTVGAVTATGGEGTSGAGGDGGNVLLRTEDGDIVAGAIDSSGGGGTAGGAGGGAGDVDVLAGVGGSGNVTMNGAITAVDGSGTGDPVNDGLGVRVFARDDVDFDPGIVGADITTTENVSLLGFDVGAGNPIEVDGVGLTPDPVNETRSLGIQAAGVARVDVTTAGFDNFIVSATSASADIDITQVAVGGDPSDGIDIDVDGAPTTLTLVRADMLDSGIDGGAGFQLQLVDELVDMDDVSLTLEIAAGAVDGSSNALIDAEDHIVLNDGSITMHPPDASPPGSVSGGVRLTADQDQDGNGAITHAGTGVAIDMNAEATNPTGSLLLLAAEGVGTGANPIVTANVDSMVAGTRDAGGVHVRNTAGGDVTLLTNVLSQFYPAFDARDGVAVAAGPGDIELTNDTGGFLVDGDVRAPGDMGSGGNVTVSVAPGSEILVAPTLPAVGDPTPGISAGGDATLVGDVVFAGASGGLSAGGDADFQGEVDIGMSDGSIDAGGTVDFAGAVDLLRDGVVNAGGDVTFADRVDSVAVTLVPRNLTVTSGGVVRFGDDVGSQFELRNLTVDGELVLDQDTDFTVLQVATFLGDVDAAADDAAAMNLTAGDGATFSGQVGTNGRLSGLAVDTDLLVFDAVGDQSVVTGAGGIALDASGLTAPPTTASIGKSGGGLRLESVGGGVILGANQKLTVDGTADLVGDVVQVGDVNALDVAVDSPDFRIAARQPGQVQVPGLGLVPDEGTDLLANTISTTSAPTVVGAGLPPRIATVSGAVDGAGAGGLEVGTLDAPVTSASLVDPTGPTFFDLFIGVPDPGNETEPDPLPVVPLLPGRPGDDPPGGSALAPDADAVLAFLACSEQAGPGEATRDCAPANGSPLDSPRGEEIAQRYRRLFGPDDEARAARALMEASSAAGSAVRRDVATLLAQLRLLGMQEAEYQRVRDDLLDEAAGADGRAALLSAVRAESRGLPL
ncbi:MAG: filamentous hemagglutinin N-terminal domain-containing protein [Myxococcota bacterium]